MFLFFFAHSHANSAFFSQVAAMCLWQLALTKPHTELLIPATVSSPGSRLDGLSSVAVLVLGLSEKKGLGVILAFQIGHFPHPLDSFHVSIW